MNSAPRHDKESRGVKESEDEEKHECTGFFDTITISARDNRHGREKIKNEGGEQIGHGCLFLFYYGKQRAGDTGIDEFLQGGFVE